MSPKSGNARAPLAVRVAMVVIAVVMAAATAWAAINLYAAVSCNDAARTLEQNVSDASQDAATHWRCCASGSNRSMTN